MSHFIECDQCHSQFTVSDNIFQNRIAGKLLTVKCQHCGGSITVDSGPSDAYQPAPQRTNFGLGLPQIPRPASMPSFDAHSESRGRTVLGLQPSAPLHAPLERISTRSAPPPITAVPAQQEVPTVLEPARPATDPVVNEASVTTVNREITPPPYAIGANAIEAGDESAIVLPIKRASGGWWAALAAALIVAGGGIGVRVFLTQGEAAAPSPVESKSEKPASKPAAQARFALAAPQALPKPKVEAASAPEPTKPTNSAPQAEKTSSADDEIPPYASAPQVLHLTQIMLRRAQKCHANGRATGTSDLFITFAPTGRVSEARLEGEPIASAAVARCILDEAQSIRIRKFDGAAFTVKRVITLR